MKNEHATGYVFMASSLDGFVARQDHSLDWLMKYDTKGQDHGYNDFIANMDVLVMGSGSFKTVLGFDQWPYQLPVFVMSTSLTQEDIPKDLVNKVTITNLNPLELMESLYVKNLKRVYVDGGKIVQSFIREELVKEITITHVPILIGDGKRLFGDIQKDIDLELITSKKLIPGFVQNHYHVVTN